MPDTAEYAWDTAEQRCYNYIATTLSGLAGVEGARAEMPRTASAISGLNQWFFAITGGTNVIVPGASDTAGIGSWHNEALWEGRFTERQLALRAIGLVRDALPVGEAVITGVQKLYIVAHPQVQRQAIELESDLSEGGLLRVWAVTIPMAVCYDNQGAL